MAMTNIVLESMKTKKLKIRLEQAMRLGLGFWHTSHLGTRLGTL